jgi:hypothetical protein
MINIAEDAATGKLAIVKLVVVRSAYVIRLLSSSNRR